jgi:hypothetical protein
MTTTSQWQVVPEGLETTPGHQSYQIHAARLSKPDWLVHMAKKEWVDLDDFVTAYICALKRHGGKVENLAAKIAEAWCARQLGMLTSEALNRIRSQSGRMYWSERELTDALEIAEASMRTEGVPLPGVYRSLAFAVHLIRPAAEIAE